MPVSNSTLDQLPDDIRAEAAVAFRDLASGLYTISGATALGRRSLKPLQLYAKTGDSVVKKIAGLEKKIDALGKAAKWLDGKPVVGPVAKALKPIANGLEIWAARTKGELLNLSETQRKIGKVVEPIAETLSKINKFALKAGVAADVYSRKLAVAGQQLEDAKQLFDTGIPFFGSDTRLNQKVLLKIAVAADDAREVASEVAGIQNVIGGIEDAIEGLVAYVDNPIFQVIEKFQNAITAVSDALSPFFAPIEKIYSALEPVLDALDSIFGWILAPLTWALEAVLEATGINDLIAAAAEKILSFLPEVGLLDDIIAELERIFLEDLKEFYEQEIEAPYIEVRDKLEDVNFPNQFAVPTEADDTLMGSLNAVGGLDIDALGGDDLLLGTEYGDTLRGGAGQDIFVGGGGDDLLDGGTNLAADPDVAIFAGSINDYGIVSILENGFASGTWFIKDLRDDTSIEGGSDRINLGTDKLVGIELVVFDDEVLDLTKIDTYIQTRSEPGELVLVTPTESNLFVGNIQSFTADGGIDLIFGALGFDYLDTGAGNDQLTSGSNDPLTEQAQRTAGDVLLGGLGNDIYVLGPRSGDKDTVFDVGGNDTVLYTNSEYGLNVFLGSTPRELLYRPTSIDIDADPFGRTVAGLDYQVGQVFGIENITGTEFADVLIGSDVVNKINGGAGDDQIRGLDGDDILLGGAGNDTLIGDGGNDFLEGGSGVNHYVAGLGDDYIVDLSSSFSQVYYAAFADTDKYSQNVDFVDFATTGDNTFSTFDMPGAIVIVPTDVPGEQQVSKYQTSVLVGDRYGVDYLEGIERIVASTGRDIIYSAAGINQIIYGNDGDDDLFTGSGDTQNQFYGGPGNDLFISDPDAQDTFFGGADSDSVRVWGANNVEGDLLFGDDNRQIAQAGIDKLDFSQSDYSWHIYMNPVASNGTLVGKAILTALYDEDPRFIQPTLGVNGVVEKEPGVTVPGEAYPEVNYYLRVADPNTSDPGGRANGVGEFEWIIGSQNRDFISGGSPDGPVTIEGQGGDDVLYASQRFAATIEGGDGNDVLGTFNDTLGKDSEQNFFDVNLRTILNGGTGNDVLVAGDFQEQFDGGEGIDLLTYEVSTAGVMVDLTNKTLDLGYATGDTLVGGIINVIGSQFDDHLTGDEMKNELIGWDGEDTLYGMGDSDQLYGNDGDDQLFGGAGNDLLHGGNGADTLDGGEDNDTASWNLYQIHPKGVLDRLTNDTSGVVADLETGQAGLDTLIGIENLLGGVGDDQLSGDDGDNFLGGNKGNDLLDGRGGNDLLLGSHGDDTLLGGDGDDYLSGGAGVNSLDGNDGIDTIDYSSLTYGVTIVMAGVGTRALFDSGEVDSLTPVDAYVWTDSITMIAGPTGLPDDMIETGTNEVRYTYQRFDQGTDDPGDDTFVQRDPITPERIWKLNPFFAEDPADLMEVAYLSDEGLLPEQEVTEIQQYVTSRDLFTSIEQIVGGKGDDSILGNSEDTFFYGRAGADTIDGGNGVDTAGYQHSEQGVTVDMTNQVFLGGEAEGDVLTNIEHLIGSAFNDVLVGNASNNRLTLGSGNDRATGGGGIDTAVFEFASTGIIFQFADGGLNVVSSLGTTVFSIDFVADDVTFLEFTDTTLTFSDAADLVIRGTEAADLLIGTPVPDPLEGLGGDDTIEGRASDDTLDGGTGNDLLKGEDGNDRLIGGAGIDQFIGGPGDDTFVVDQPNEIIQENLNEGFDTVETGINFTLPANVEAATIVGGGTVTVTGNSLANALTGDAGSQTLLGLGGNDTLDGKAGADIMIGGPGDDTYHVDHLDDVVGPETASGGFDVVITTVDTTVIEHVERFVVGGDASITLTGDDGANVFIDGTNSLSGDNDPLQGAGNSTFEGGKGEDSLTLAFDFETSTLAMDAEGFLLISNGTQTDRARSIEFFEFTDGSYTFNDLIELIYPAQHVQLFAGDRYETDFPIDMTPEGGGDQFLYTGPRNSGDNDGNRFYFRTDFENGGKGIFEGTGLLNQATGTVTRLAVDFSGGNTTQMSVGGFSKPFLTMRDADWLFYQNAIFGGDDRITGSYYDDKLVGYRGDDTIFGGLGDKEQYNVEGSTPSPRPSTLRNPGDIASDPDFFVHDGDDLIDGREGNDLLDGGTGADTLLGGEGNDQLFGGGGVFADRLDGGAGNDTMFGGEGADVVVLGLGMGQDIMLDFEVGVDALDYSGLSSAEFASLTVNIDGPNTVIGLSDGSSLTLSNVMLPQLPAQVVDLGSNNINGLTFDIGASSNTVAVSGLGDINDDGVDDFAIGNSWVNTGNNFPSKFVPNTTVFLGDATQPGAETFQVLSGLEAYGLALSSAGDFNHDGIDDLIVATHDETHIVFGKASPFDPSINLDDLDGSDGFQINVSGDYFNPFVTGGFDFNGDGIADVLIGASADNNAEGAAYVVFGSDAPFAAELDVTALDGTNGFQLIGTSQFGFVYLGETVGSAGDVNGDGIEDLIIGAPYMEVEDPNDPGTIDLIGGAYILYGNNGPQTAVLDLNAMTAQQGTRITGVFADGQERTGRNVDGGGDVNGDGFDDIIIGVGRPTSQGLPDQPDRAYLIYGSAGGLGALMRLEDLDGNNGTAFNLDFPGPNYNALGTSSVAIVDDINNDRLADIVIGTKTLSLFDPPNPSVKVRDGKIFVLYGDEDGFGATLNLDELSATDGFIIATPDGAGFGGHVASAGDVNNDGGNDILLGATDAPSVILFGEPFSNLPLSGAIMVVGIPAEDQLLSVDTSGMSDPDGLGALNYQWLRNGVPVIGADSATYILGDLDVNAAISVQVSFTDGFGTLETLTSEPTTIVENVNDDPGGAVTVTGNTTQGETLTATDTLFDNDGLGIFSYQWYADDILIDGATAANYKLIQADVGKSITVTVSYTDGGGIDETVTSDASAPVTNINDLPSGEVTIAGNTSVGQILTASNTLMDPDGLGIIAYQWLADGTPIDGATATSYELTEDELGKTISVSASYTDAGGTAESVTSAISEVVTGLLEGVVADGYVASAQLFVDNNLNGIPDPEEDTGLTTDANGAFSLPIDQATAPILAVGGTNIDTGLPNTLLLSAPQGSAVLNPITSLIQGYIAVTGGSSADAEAFIQAALGIDGELDLTEYDPLAQDPVDDTAIAVQVVAAQIGTIGTLSGDSSGAFADLVGYLIAAGTGVTDLSDQSVLQAMFPTLDASVLTQIAAVNQVVATAGSLQDIAQTQSNSQDESNDAPVVTSVLSDQQTDQYKPFNYQLPASTFIDVDPGDILTFSATEAGSSGLPAWLNFNSQTRVFSGTPGFGDNGALVIDITATDSAQASVTTSLNININTLLLPQASITGGNRLVVDSDQQVGEQVLFNATATDQDGTVVLTQWLVNNQIVATGLAPLIALPDGPSLVTFRVTDNDGLVSTDSANITVESATTGLSLVGGAGDDTLIGDSGNDTLVGNGGRDTLQGFGGDDVLDGGADLDHAVFQNALVDFTIVNNAGQLLVSGPANDGEDLLDNVERLQFIGSSLAFDLDDNAGTIAKLLGVVLGKDNWYNKTYVGIGLDILDNSAIAKTNLMDLAFEVILGKNPSNTAVVNLIYNNLVGQAPSQQELSSLTADLLGSGAYTQGSLGVLALDHEFNLANIDLVGLTLNGVEYFQVM